MSTSDLALIALGILAQVATFAIGVLVGRRTRRDDHDHGSTDEEEPTIRFHDRDNNVAAGARRRGGRRAEPASQADLEPLSVWDEELDGD